jgi:hypothetical protein
MAARRGYRRVKHLVQQNVLTGVRQETKSANDEEGSGSSNHHASSFARFCCIFEGPSRSRRSTGGSFAEGVVVFGGVNVLRDAITPHISRYLTIVGAGQRNHLREITADPRRTCIVGSTGSLACIAAGLSTVHIIKSQ